MEAEPQPGALARQGQLAVSEALTRGVVRRSRAGVDVTYRFLVPGDDIDAITSLLHRAYAPLAKAGLRFSASHQTARRPARGETIVADIGGRLVGLVTLARAAATSGSPYYDRPDVASFGQFAVEPDYQRSGIGSALVDFVEALAAERGVSHLALDTSEQATGLIRFYTTRGYRFVEHVRWPEVNYRSVILAKPVHQKSQMAIRPATPEDARAIARIHVRSWQAAYRDIVPPQFLDSLSVDERERAWRQRLAGGASGTWVLEEHGDVLGWVSVGPSRDADALPSTRELWAIYVAPEQWRRGVGQRLWEEMEGQLGRAGCSEVTLWVLKENTHALGFYHANGFLADPGIERLVELGGASLVEIRLSKPLAP